MNLVIGHSSNKEGEITPPSILKEEKPAMSARRQRGKNKEQESDTFYEKAQYWMDHTYPDWKNKLDPEFDSEETLCIPDCLDVAAHRYLGPTNPNAAGFDEKEERSRVKGVDTEKKFFIEFRKLKLGGILIHGFYSSDFIGKMYQLGVAEFKDKKSGIQHFECDFIFIHQRFGIIVAEVKGTDQEKGRTEKVTERKVSKVTEKFQEAVGQLKRQIPGLQMLYKRVSGKSTCPFEVQGFICMPLFDATTPRNRKEKQELESKYSFHLMDKSELYNGKKSKKFWETFPHQRSAFKDEDRDKEDVIKFIVALIAHRPAKFISAASNVLEIHRLILRQDFKNDNKKSKIEKKQLFFFNEEQLKATECKSRRVLITGPPGTGKTLCLLERARNAAKIEKPGDVVLLVPYNITLLRKFKKFCADEDSAQRRNFTFKIVVYDDTLSDITPDDDVFFDEVDFTTGSESIEAKFHSNLSNRSLTTGTGSTTVVITGTMNPSSINFLNETCEMYTNFEQFHLKTVVRGTISIIKQWKSHFDDHFFYIGHNIDGLPTERCSFTNSSEMFELVHSKIMLFLSKIDVKGDHWQSLFGTPADIAVLIWNYRKNSSSSSDSDSEQLVERMKSYLSNNNLPCGPIIKQVDNSSLIAVDDIHWAMSYEWPFVIVVVFIDDTTSSPIILQSYYDPITISRSYKHDLHYYNFPFYVMATSRAIAKLIVIEVKMKDIEFRQLIEETDDSEESEDESEVSDEGEETEEESERRFAMFELKLELLKYSLFRWSCEVLRY